MQPGVVSIFTALVTPALPARPRALQVQITSVRGLTTDPRVRALNICLSLARTGHNIPSNRAGTIWGDIDDRTCVLAPIRASIFHFPADCRMDGFVYSERRRQAN